MKPIAASFILAFFIIWIAFAIPPAQAQEEAPVMKCINYPSHFIKELWPPDPDLLEVLYSIEGIDAWLGYEAIGEAPQWGITDGYLHDIHPEQRERLFFRYGKRADGQYKAAVLIESDPSHPKDIYFFTFYDLTSGTDQNGNHYGSHPCGVWLISPEQLALIMGAR